MTVELNVFALQIPEFALCLSLPPPVYRTAAYTCILAHVIVQYRALAFQIGIHLCIRPDVHRICQYSAYSYIVELYSVLYLTFRRVQLRDYLADRSAGQIAAVDILYNVAGTDIFFKLTGFLTVYMIRHFFVSKRRYSSHKKALLCPAVKVVGHSLLYSFPLKLCKNQYHPEHCFTRNACCIKLLSRGHEIHIMLFQFTVCKLKIKHGTAHSVDLVDYYLTHSSCFNIRHHALKIRAVGVFSAVTSVAVYYHISFTFFELRAAFLLLRFDAYAIFFIN